MLTVSTRMKLSKAFGMILVAAIFTETTCKNLRFAQLGIVDRRPTVPAVYTTFYVSKLQCAADCSTNKRCWTFFHYTKSGACRHFDIVNFNTDDLVFEAGSVSYLKDCRSIGFSLHDGLCFKISKLKMTREDARSECDKFGSSLAILDTTELFDWMLHYLKDKHYTGAFSIGMSYTKSEGTWIWDNLNPVDRKIFITGQPNDYDITPGYRTRGADCGFIDGDIGGALDYHCDHPFKFICQAYHLVQIEMPIYI